MDLSDQLKKLFPDHEPEQDADSTASQSESIDIWMQEDPIVCKYEKRKGKPITILEGYNGAKEDFKKLAQFLKKQLSVGGSIKGDTIIIQGDYRDRIMTLLKEMGFEVKRVGG